MKIMVAEDNSVLRVLLCELLMGWGHEILVAADGSEALRLVTEGRQFDMAILDWMMPGHAGPDVCVRIRQAQKERHPYVLILTAKSQPEDIVRGLDAGADEYLTKPYRPPELAARLRAAERYMGMQDELIETKKALRQGDRIEVRRNSLAP